MPWLDYKLFREIWAYWPGISVVTADMLKSLILTTNEVIGSLLAQLNELSGNSYKFANADEPFRTAIRRIEPDVILMDARFGQEAIDSVIDAAKAAQSAIVLFGGSFSPLELKSVANRRELPYLALPMGPKAFNILLLQAVNDRQTKERMEDMEVEQRITVN